MQLLPVPPHQEIGRFAGVARDRGRELGRLRHQLAVDGQQQVARFQTRFLGNVTFDERRHHRRAVGKRANFANLKTALGQRAEIGGQRLPVTQVSQRDFAVWLRANFEIELVPRRHRRLADGQDAIAAPQSGLLRR